MATTINAAKGARPDLRTPKPADPKPADKGPNPVPVRGTSPIAPTGANGAHAPGAANGAGKPEPAKAEAPKPAAPDANKVVAASEPAKVTPVEPLTFVTLPIAVLRAAALCASKDSDRPNLTGVYLHRQGPTLRCIGTDGKRMLVLSFEPDDDKLPGWLEAGAIIPAGGLKARLALIDGENLRLGFATAAPRLVLKDPDGSAVFRLLPLEGAFPDYRKIMADMGDVFLSGGNGDFASVALEPEAFKGVADIAKALECESVRVFAGGPESGTARVVTIPDFPGAVLYQMPAKADARPVLPADTRALLSPALKATVAALKAHATRWLKAEKEATTATEREIARERIAHYGTRVSQAMEAEAKGLPAPTSPKKDLPPEVAFGPGAAPVAKAASANGAAQPSTVKALPAPASPPPKAAPPISRGVITKAKGRKAATRTKRGKAA